MFTQKISYIWVVNLVMFMVVVFLGIEQAGKGSDIAKLEDQIDTKITIKRELSDKLFNLNTDDKLVKSGQELGFVKPGDVLYFNSEDVSLTLR